jgi:hypothetical protein
MKTLLLITALTNYGYGKGEISFGYIMFENPIACERAKERLEFQDAKNKKYTFEMLCVEQ